MLHFYRKLTLLTIFLYPQVFAVSNQATETDEINDPDPGLTPDPAFCGFADSRPLDREWFDNANENKELFLHLHVGDIIIKRKTRIEGIAHFWILGELIDNLSYSSKIREPTDPPTLQIHGFKAGLGYKRGQQTYKFDATNAKPGTYVATFHFMENRNDIIDSYHVICKVDPIPNNSAHKNSQMSAELKTTSFLEGPTAKRIKRRRKKEKKQGNRKGKQNKYTKNQSLQVPTENSWDVQVESRQNLRKNSNRGKSPLPDLN